MGFWWIIRSPILFAYLVSLWRLRLSPAFVLINKTKAFGVHLGAGACWGHRWNLKHLQTHALVFHWTHISLTFGKSDICLKGSWRKKSIFHSTFSRINVKVHRLPASLSSFIISAHWLTMCHFDWALVLFEFYALEINTNHVRVCVRFFRWERERSKKRASVALDRCSSYIWMIADMCVMGWYISVIIIRGCSCNHIFIVYNVCFFYWFSCIYLDHFELLNVVFWVTFHFCSENYFVSVSSRKPKWTLL